MSKCHSGIVHDTLNTMLCSENLDITDFTSSWKSGLAFCAIFYHYRPNLMQVNFQFLLCKNIKVNFFFSVI